MTKLLWQEITESVQRTYADAYTGTLAYYAILHGTPMDKHADEYAQELSVYIDTAGNLYMEFYQCIPSFHYEDPPEDKVTLYTFTGLDPLHARHTAEKAMAQITAYGKADWEALGFTMQVL